MKLSTLSAVLITTFVCTAVLNVPKVLPKAVAAEDYIGRCESLMEGTYQGITETGDLVTIRHGRATFKRYDISHHTAVNETKEN